MRQESAQVMPDAWAVAPSTARACRSRAANPRIESFDLNLLRVLDALLVTCSVSAAARRLDLSQPATSSALARLRDSLRDPILVRDGNRMVPTPLAEELRSRLARILGDIGAALASTAGFDPASSERRFRIGANDYAALIVLIPLAARLRQLAPHATLEILPLNGAPDLALATREVDLLVADRWSVRELRQTETLFREFLVSIARVDHPRLSEHVDLDEFLAVDHASISPCGIQPGILDNALEAVGRSRHVALTVPHYLVAPSVVANTDLVMTLPSRVALTLVTGRIRVFDTPIELEGFDVVVAFHPRSHAEPAIQWLKQLLGETSAGLRSVGHRVRAVQ